MFATKAIYDIIGFLEIVVLRTSNFDGLEDEFKERDIRGECVYI